MEMNQRKIGALLSYIITIVNAVVGFIYIPLLTNFMGESEYGLYALMGSLIALLSVMDFGLSSTITRFYSKYKTLNDKKSMENILALSCIIYAAITVLLLIVSTVIYFNIEIIFANSLTPSEIISAKGIFIILIINLMVSIPSKVFDAVIISHERFIFLKTATIIQIVFQPFVVIAVMYRWPSAFAMVIVQTIFNLGLIFSKVYYSFFRMKIQILLHKFDKPLFIEMIKYSLYIFLGAILDQLFWKSNHIILGIYTNTVVVGMYSLATTMTNMYMSLSTAITSVFLPKITRLITQKATNEVISDIFIQIGRLQFLLLSCILSGFIIFGKQFIKILAPRFNTSDIYIIALILMVPFTVDLIQNIGLTILQAKNKMAFRSISFLVISLLNVIVSIPMAINYGAIGCACTAGITFFIGTALLMNIYYYKVIHLDIKSYWINIIKIAIPSIGCTFFGWLLNYLLNGTSMINLIIKGMIYVVMYVTVMWIFSMNSYEKSLLGSLRKVLHI